MRLPPVAVALLAAFPLLVACSAGPASATGVPAPGVPATVAPPSVGAAPGPRVPADVLDLANWSLTLPIGAEGDPVEVRQPELASYADDWFRVDAAGTGVAFTANAGGVTTENSGYPRSELRERVGGERAAWSNGVGAHTLEVRQAVTALPEVKPHVVTAQIHDAEDDVLEVRLEGSRLLAEYDDGDGSVELDPDYRLGTFFDLAVVATAGRVRVLYDGEERADLPLTGDGWYFKVGSYVQSSPERGDRPDAVGTVVVERLLVTHEN